MAACGVTADAPSRDGDEAGEQAVAGHARIGLAGLDPHDRHGRHGAGRGGEGGRHGDRADGRVGRQLRARVEAVPAHEEDEHAKEGERQAVAGDDARVPVGVVLADAGAEDLGTPESAHATGHVHEGRAGEIVERRVHLVGPAAAPLPAHGHRVDDHADHEAVHEVRLELRALGHGPETIVAAVAANATWNMNNTPGSSVP